MADGLPCWGAFRFRSGPDGPARGRVVVGFGGVRRGSEWARTSFAQSRTRSWRAANGLDCSGLPAASQPKTIAEAMDVCRSISALGAARGMVFLLPLEEMFLLLSSLLVRSKPWRTIAPRALAPGVAVACARRAGPRRSESILRRARREGAVRPRLSTPARDGRSSFPAPSRVLESGQVALHASSQRHSRGERNVAKRRRTRTSRALHVLRKTAPVIELYGLERGGVAQPRRRHRTARARPGHLALTGRPRAGGAPRAAPSKPGSARHVHGAPRVDHGLARSVHDETPEERLRGPDAAARAAQRLWLRTVRASRLSSSISWAISGSFLTRSSTRSIA